MNLSDVIDPITGEIDWDCPCLEGKAQGPCADVFKIAFKCFIDNQDNPEKYYKLFEIMQECFEKYPELYN